MEFEILGLTGNQQEYLKKRAKEKMWAAINDIPEQEGVYIITFPNGKKYIGESKNLRQRIREHLYTLLAPSKTVYFWKKGESGDYLTNWYITCLEENPNMKFTDLKIDYRLTSEHKQVEHDMLCSVEDRSRYYNSKWF